MKVFLIILAAIVFSAFLLGGGYLWWLWSEIFGNRTDYSWHQEISIAVETPNGPVEARTVQQVQARYFGGRGAFMTQGTEVAREVTGEALMADLGDGRMLFVLLGSGGWAEDVYRDLGNRKEIYKALSGPNPPAPREIPFDRMPQMVTFGDVSDPSSVQAVDPGNLAATFGPGYALKAVTFGITRDPVTTSVIEEVLIWLVPYSERKLCRPDGRTTDIPLCMQLYQSYFIRRPR